MIMKIMNNEVIEYTCTTHIDQQKSLLDPHFKQHRKCHFRSFSDKEIKL